MSASLLAALAEDTILFSQKRIEKQIARKKKKKPTKSTATTKFFFSSRCVMIFPKRNLFRYFLSVPNRISV